MRSAIVSGTGAAGAALKASPPPAVTRTAKTNIRLRSAIPAIIAAIGGSVHCAGELFAPGELKSFFEHRVRAPGFGHQEPVAERDHFLDVVGFDVGMAARNVVLIAGRDDLGHRGD